MAKVIVPRRFEPFTGSSWICASFQAAATSGLPVDAELGHEVREHAEERHVVEEAGLHEVVEAVGSARSERALHFDDEPPLRRVEADPKAVGRASLGPCGIQECGSPTGWARGMLRG